MSEIEKERRLEWEANHRRLGTLGEFADSTDAARVEVTYTEADGLERCGYFIVNVRVPADYDPAAEDALEWHPATLAENIARAELERQFPDAEYLSVDDVYAA